MKKMHEPVMASEILEVFDAHLKKNKGKVIDATLGFGGHTVKLLKKGYQVLGIEADKECFEEARKRVEKACPSSESDSREKYTLVHANFKELDTIAKSVGFEKVNGVLFDLGVNLYQLTSPKRGFSFKEKSALLDMRLDQESQKVTAADLLNSLRMKQLVNLFGVAVSFPEARKLSRSIEKARKIKPFSTVQDLLSVIPKKPSIKGAINPATKIFMALRLAVNSELENLEEALPKAYELLEPGGVLAVLTFHSGEDRIVKKYFKDLAEKNNIEKRKQKPIIPSDEEIKRNPKARSAKLRFIRKI